MLPSPTQPLAYTLAGRPVVRAVQGRNIGHESTRHM